MTTTKLDADTLLAMADHIEEVPANRLRMHTYWGTNGCGCILGHCVNAGLILGYTVRADTEDDGTLLRDGKPVKVDDFADDIGLPVPVAQRVFDTDFPVERSPDGAARVLRYVAQHGTLDGYVKLADAP